MVANLIKVKVYPKDLKSIPDVLPYNKLIQGEPVILELTKKEILRCMNFADVFDIRLGDEVLIDEKTFDEIEEYVEESSEEVIVEESEKEPEVVVPPTTGDEEPTV